MTLNDLIMKCYVGNVNKLKLIPESNTAKQLLISKSQTVEKLGYYTASVKNIFNDCELILLEVWEFGIEDAQTLYVRVHF